MLIRVLILVVACVANSEALECLFDITITGTQKVTACEEVRIIKTMRL